MRPTRSMSMRWMQTYQRSETECDEVECDGAEEMRKRILDQYMKELYELEFNDMVRPHSAVSSFRKTHRRVPRIQCLTLKHLTTFRSKYDQASCIVALLTWGVRTCASAPPRGAPTI